MLPDSKHIVEITLGRAPYRGLKFTASKCVYCGVRNKLLWKKMFPVPLSLWEYYINDFLDLFVVNLDVTLGKTLKIRIQIIDVSGCLCGGKRAAL